MRNETLFKRLFDAYAGRKDIQVEMVMFFLDVKAITEHHTPKMLKMEVRLGAVHRV